MAFFDTCTIARGRTLDEQEFLSRFVDDDEDEKSIRLFFTFPTGEGKSPNYDFGISSYRNCCRGF